MTAPQHTRGFTSHYYDSARLTLTVCWLRCQLYHFTK